MKFMPKNKQSFTKLIILLLVIILLVIAMIFIFQNNSGSEIKSQTYLEDRLRLASNSLTDDNYFESITYDHNNNYTHIVEFVAGKKHTYRVFLPYITFAQWTNGANGAPALDTGIISVQLINAASNPGSATLPEIHGIITKDIIKPNPFVAFISNYWPMLIFITLIAGSLYFNLKMSRQANGGSGGFFNPGQNQAKKVKSDKRFSDVAGNTESKEEIMELVDYLKNPKKYSVAGAKIPKGILLGGPPGTGKTLLAKATAGEAGVPFFFISASNFVELYVGVGAKRVRELFKDARKAAPAIIFIDELDAVGRSRGAGIGGGNDEREQTLNQLLVEMDGIEENNGILVIAATNRTDVLDSALQRPGRFDRTITVNLPDVKEREEILSLHAKSKRLDPSIAFSNIAKRTPGFSGAQLENVINEASILSVRENTKVITPKQIDEAIDRVMAGPAKKNRTITEEERTMVAYHEAGHAVVGLKTPGGNKVQKITIIPRGFAGGYNLMIPENEKFTSTKKELEAMIASFMGGRAAELLIYGPEKISTGAANDFAKATKIARKMVTEYGMSPLGPIQFEEETGNPFLGKEYSQNKSYSAKLADDIETEVRKIILNAQLHAQKTLKQNTKLLELIKEELLEKETIVSEEIEYLAKHLKRIPKSIEVKKIAKESADIEVLDDLISGVKKDNQKKIKAFDEEVTQDEKNSADDSGQME